MQIINSILNSFYRGKETYGPIRRILDLLLSISLAAFLFKIFYFNYELLDITDYKGAINFLLNGDFVIPFILFLLSHYLTHFIGYLFFALSTTRKTTKWIEQIVKIKVEKSDLEFDTKKINKTGIIKLPPINRSWIVDAYRALKSILSQQQWIEAERRIRLQTEVVRKNFQLLFKALILVSIYYFWAVKHFNGFLYAISIIGIVGGMVFLWYAYAVLDVLPTFIRKIDAEIEKHVRDEPVQAQSN